MKKRVVILKNNLSSFGGLEKYTFRMAEAFSAKGCQVALLTTQCDKEKWQSQNYEIINLPAKSPLKFLQLHRFDALCQQWIAENHPDIVFGMDRNTSQSHYRAGNGVHAEYLSKRAATDSFWKNLSFRFNPLHRTILYMEKKTYESPHLEKLFTNSAMVKDEILRHYQINPSKIHIVHNGVEWHEMQKAFNDWGGIQAQTLIKLGLDPSAFQFLFVGKGYRRKGLEFLLAGLSKLKERHFQLSVVGNDREIPFFKAKAKALGLEKQIHFFGHRSDLIQFYQASDVLVIPSTYDPFANTTIEALAMGLFVVSSKFNGGSEILTPSTGAVIEDLFNQDSLVAALQEAIKHPKTLARAKQIRLSVMPMDFAQQLHKIVDATLS